MAVTETDGYVMVTVTEEEIEQMRPDGDGIRVECPVTGDTIYLGDGRPEGGTCDCCGQELPDPEITPAILPEVLLDGRRQIFPDAHSRGDIMIIVQGNWDVRMGTRDHLRS